MRDKEEIFYSECCALCTYFKDGNGGCENSILGNCTLKEVKVWTHLWCEDFELDTNLAESFDLM